MMSFIKRGSLTCLLFFILALIAGSGPRASKVAVAFGALVIVGILITSPITTVITDVDSLIKNDWQGVSDTGSGSASTGTQAVTGGNNGGTVKTLTQSEIAKLLNTTIGSPAYNSFTAEIRAFKSGEVWKLPVDAVNTLEQTGIHMTTSAFDRLKSFLGHIF